MGAENPGQEKTIAGIIFKSMRGSLLGILAAVGLLCAAAHFTGIVIVARKSLRDEVRMAAEHVACAVRSYRGVAGDIGTYSRMGDVNVPVTEKEKILDAKCQEYGFTRGRIINIDGSSPMDDHYFGDTMYFHAALHGRPYLSEPVKSKIDSELCLVAAAPLWENLLYGGNVNGIVAFSLSPSLLNRVISEIGGGKGKIVYVLGSSGTAVAASDERLVYAENNNIRNAIRDRSFEKIAQIERQMLTGRSGISFYFKGLSPHFCAFHPVPDVPGWSLAVHTPLGGYFGSFYWLLLLLAAAAGACVWFIVRKSRNTAEQISAPFNELADRITRAAAGDLTSDVTGEGGIQEARVIGDAASNLAGRLYLTVTDVEEYRDGARLADLVDHDLLKSLQVFYREILGMNLLVNDAKGEIVAGGENLAANGRARMPADRVSSSIKVDGRVLGSVYLWPGPTARPEDVARMESSMLPLTLLISKVAADAFRRNLQNRTHVNRIQSSVRNLIYLNNRISGKIQRWISEFPNGEDVAAGPQAAQETLAAINAAVDYARMTDLQARITEKVYAVSDLIGEIQRFSARCFARRPDVRVEAYSDRSVPDFLFGDRDGIRHMVVRIAQVLAAGGIVLVCLTATREHYALLLQISISNDRRDMPEEEFDRMRAYLQGDKALSGASGVNVTQLRLVAALQVLQQMNGKIVLERAADGQVTYKLTIPQLEIHEKASAL